jgi:hypothetical protein
VVFADDGAVTRSTARRHIPVLPIGGSLGAGTTDEPTRDPAPDLPVATIRTLARSLGIERLEAKVRLQEERLKEIVAEAPRLPGPPTGEHASGQHRSDHLRGEAWDQLLYEGVMEAMGFAKNRAPFLLLARTVRLSMLQRFGLNDRETLTALLFGAAGLLPSAKAVADRESRLYVRLLRRRWCQISPLLRVTPIHPGDWLFFRLRPANFPPARLAAVVDLLPGLFAKGALGLFLARDPCLTPAEWWRAVRLLFAVPPDHFWSNHVHFAAAVRRRSVGLGTERLLDIVANLLVPAMLMLHRSRGDAGEALARCAALLEHLPAASRDTLVRSLGRLSAQPLRPANLLEHQGMIELVLRR